MLGRPLDSREVDLFEKYLLLLKKWQSIHRLVGSSDPAWVVEHLFLDSLLFLRVLPSEVSSIADLGSGAGFPGIPIKIVRPDLGVTLIESRQRRASFLAAVIRELGLTKTRVLAERAHDVRDRVSGSIGAVVTRCAGEIEEILPLASSMLAHGGIVIIAGSPNPKPLAQGNWIEVAGPRPGATRSFAVLRL